MKIAALSIGLLLVLNQATAQMKEGSITYERKMNMHRRMPPQDERMKNIVPEFVTEKEQVSFNENESISKQLPKEQDVREHAGEQKDAVFISAGGGVNDEVYKNYSTKKTIEVRELGPKKYLIEDALENFGWKIDASATKTVKGYECKKATGKSKLGEHIVAWYTEQISCPSGPAGFGGLPGMILELSINDGETIYSAMEISDKKQLVVKAPAKGKKTSRKEFDKMVETEFGPPPGGAQPVRIAF